MKDLYDIIGQVRLRPAMYIGDKKISSLAQFLGGCSCALRINGIHELPEFHLFHQWIRQRLQLKPSGIPYWKTLSRRYGGEEKALEMFFEFVDEYRKERKSTAS